MIENLQSLCLTCHAELHGEHNAQEKKDKPYDFGRHRRWNQKL